MNEFTTLMATFPAVPKNLRLAFLEPVVLLINLIDEKHVTIVIFSSFMKYLILSSL